MHHVGCMISPELNVVQDRVQGKRGDKKIGRRGVEENKSCIRRFIINIAERRDQNGSLKDFRNLPDF